jgi:D-alanyl-D-alanine carboxypeptidase
MRATIRLLVSLALVALIGTIPPPEAAAAATPHALLDRSAARPKVASHFAILVDAQSGEVLWSRRATATGRPRA